MQKPNQQQKYTQVQVQTNIMSPAMFISSFHELKSEKKRLKKRKITLKKKHTTTITESKTFGQFQLV